MKIVVLDGMTLNPGDLSWESLEKLGSVTVYERTPESLILERAKDAEILFTNKTPISKDTLDQCANLKFIGVLATGYNIVDVEYAKQKGIPVSNVPNYGSHVVGQFAIALLLEIAHHIGHHFKRVSEGAWSNHADWCFWDTSQIELSGKTMGIIGYGNIGRTTGRIAQALNMNVVAYDRNQDKSLENTQMKYVDLEELFQKSDVVVLHCPLLPETEDIICKKSIDKMKEGVIIINNSRGSLVNEKDLAEALNRGKVYAAGLDVLNVEPMDPASPLATAKNCFVTPHISWAAKEARLRIMNCAVENLKKFLNQQPQNVVNK